jgi:hypothetical protein
MSVLKTGALNVKWTYENTSQDGYSAPFEVPIDLVNTMSNETMNGAVLSDYITLGTTGSPLLSIKNGNTTIYDLQAMVLKEHFNFISAKVHVDKTNFKGIMGLAERTVNDLFLAEGIYALWSRDAANPVEDGKLPGKNMYGVHPFYMAKDQQGKWFGVYTNLAAAQDWKVKYDKTNGVADVNLYAAGGLGDLYFLMGDTPNDVTKLYHSAITGNPVTTP